MSWERVDRETHERLLRLVAKGETYRSIGIEVGVGPWVVKHHVNRLGGFIRADVWAPSPARLSLEERIEIRIGLERDLSFRAIATAVDRDPSTICREVNANGGRQAYKPMAAHRAACLRARRPKLTKLAANPDLCARVICDLEQLWSPKQIAQRLRSEFGDDATMSISH